MKCFLNIERRFKEIHSEIDVRIAAIFFSHSFPFLMLTSGTNTKTSNESMLDFSALLGDEDQQRSCRVAQDLPHRNPLANEVIWFN